MRCECVCVSEPHHDVEGSPPDFKFDNDEFVGVPFNHLVFVRVDPTKTGFKFQTSFGARINYQLCVCGRWKVVSWLTLKRDSK